MTLGDPSTISLWKIANWQPGLESIWRGCGGAVCHSRRFKWETTWRLIATCFPVVVQVCRDGVAFDCGVCSSLSGRAYERCSSPVFDDDEVFVFFSRQVQESIPVRRVCFPLFFFVLWSTHIVFTGGIAHLSRFGFGMFTFHIRLRFREADSMMEGMFHQSQETRKRFSCF